MGWGAAERLSEGGREDGDRERMKEKERQREIERGRERGLQTSFAKWAYVVDLPTKPTRQTLILSCLQITF